MNKVNMRAQFVKTTSDLMAEDARVSLLLGDIGVHGFRDVLKNYPDRAFNIGILEQSTIGIAAGFASMNMVPIVHTIAPFIVERAYEQLKVDFGYQNLGGNFVSVGASYDYAALGCTHHCPSDIGVLQLIPNMEIYCPGSSSEFDSIFRETYSNPAPKYFRLSEMQNTDQFSVKRGRAEVVKTGQSCVIIAVGNMLSKVMEATIGLDVTILYYTSIKPFDSETLLSVTENQKKIVICEPYYSAGGLISTVSKLFNGKNTTILSIGMDTIFSNHYGLAREHDAYHGIDTIGIKKSLDKFINE
jgi:transketolase